MIKSKKAEALNIMFKVASILLLLAFISWIIIYKLSPSAVAPLNYCTGGAWTKEPCDTSVSMENPMMSSRMINKEKRYCCIPKAGLDEQFKETYADELKNSPALENSNSNNEVSSTNKPIEFELNGKPVTLAKTADYTTNPTIGGIILTGDKQSFKIKQHIVGKNGEKVAKCKFTIRPVEVKDLGSKKVFSQSKSASGDFELDTGIIDPCEDSISKTNVTLLALNKDPFKDSPFYKWDFTYWYENSQNDIAGDGSAIAFISTKDVGSNSDDAGKPFLEHFFERVTRKNDATCYVYVGVNEGDGEESMPSSSYYDLYVDDGTNKAVQTIYDITELPFSINLAFNSKANLFFKDDNLEQEYSRLIKFDECNKIVINTLKNYESHYLKCLDSKDYACTYSRKACESNSRYPSDDCVEDLANCYWEYSLTGGSCLNCETKKITSCEDYTTSGSCENNQCQGNTSNSRCYWKSKLLGGSCKTCNYDNICSSYDKKSDCEKNPCKFSSEIKDCKWESGKCVIKI